jgi:hypothetical protein
MKKIWTQDSARAHISKVKSGKAPYGLTFCSACDFLGLSVYANKPEDQKRIDTLTGKERGA